MAAGMTISDRAADKIKQLLTTENSAEKGLRLKVIGGGCSGLQYKMELDAEKPGDRVFEKEGAKVLVDMKSLLYLNGTELDYKDELMQAGFVFQNPNVKRSCGCGTSFGV